MKKLCMILSALLVMTALTLPVSATSGSVTLTASVATVRVGDRFTVVATLNNMEKINMGTVALDYDAAALEMVGGTCHVSGFSIGQVLPDMKAGTFFQMTNTVVSGEIFTFEFQVKENAALGDYAITGEAAIGTAQGQTVQVVGTKIAVVSGGEYQTPNTDETVPQDTTAPTQLKPTQPQETVVSTQPQESTAPTVTQGTQSTDPTPEPSGPVETTKPTEDTKEPNAPATWWIFPVIAIAVGGAAALLLLRKKKQNN